MSAMSDLDFEMRCLVGELVDFVGTHGLPQWMHDQLEHLLLVNMPIEEEEE